MTPSQGPRCGTTLVEGQRHGSLTLLHDPAPGSCILLPLQHDRQAGGRAMNTRDQVSREIPDSLILDARKALLDIFPDAGASLEYYLQDFEINSWPPTDHAYNLLLNALCGEQFEQMGRNRPKQTKKKSLLPTPSKKRALPGPTERTMLWQTLNEKGYTSLDADDSEWRNSLITVMIYGYTALSSHDRVSRLLNTAISKDGPRSCSGGVLQNPRDTGHLLIIKWGDALHPGRLGFPGSNLSDKYGNDKDLPGWQQLAMLRPKTDQFMALVQFYGEREYCWVPITSIVSLFRLGPSAIRDVLSEVGNWATQALGFLPNRLWTNRHGQITRKKREAIQDALCHTPQDASGPVPMPAPPLMQAAFLPLASYLWQLAQGPGDPDDLSAAVEAAADDRYFSSLGSGGTIRRSPITVVTTSCNPGFPHGVITPRTTKKNHPISVVTTTSGDSNHQYSPTYLPISEAIKDVLNDVAAVITGDTIGTQLDLLTAYTKMVKNPKISPAPILTSTNSDCSSEVDVIVKSPRHKKRKRSGVARRLKPSWTSWQHFLRPTNKIPRHSYMKTPRHPLANPEDPSSGREWPPPHFDNTDYYFNTTQEWRFRCKAWPPPHFDNSEYYFDITHERHLRWDDPDSCWCANGGPSP